MKKTLLAMTMLAAVTASPAFAASAHRAHHVDPNADLGYARSGAYDPDVVIEDNRVIGRDPDAGIRSQMRKDWAASEY